MTDHPAPISHREAAATLLARPWRVGGELGRTVFVWPGDNSCVIGMLDLRELAAIAVAAFNWSLVGTADPVEAAERLGLGPWEHA